MINRKRIGCLLGLILLVLSACSQDTDIYLEEYGENALAEDASGIDMTAQTDVPDTESDDTEEVCYVYICGAVVHPGVYAFPTGSRIYEVIEAAGGMTEESDDTLVNQAELVTDGMMIRIYTQAEADELRLKEGDTAEGRAQSDGRVDINSASVTELMMLPGIGSAKAEAIVVYREEYGAFSSIEDLMNIPGIKEGVFRQIREHIKVNK